MKTIRELQQTLLFDICNIYTEKWKTAKVVLPEMCIYFGKVSNMPIELLDKKIQSWDIIRHRVTIFI